MKYLLIFIILGQVCADKGSGLGPPPYFYMQCFDTKEEAQAEQENLSKKHPTGKFTEEIQSIIIRSPDCGFNSWKKGPVNP